MRTSPKSYRSRLFQVTNSKFLFSKFLFIQEIWMNVFFHWPMNMWHRGYSRVCTDELSISDRHSRYSQFRPNNNSGMRGLTTWNKNSSNIIRLFQTRQNWQYRHQRLYYMKIKKKSNNKMLPPVMIESRITAIQVWFSPFWANLTFGCKSEKYLLPQIVMLYWF